ncbi:YncE family protein [Clostridium akagii]|uniref:YncE family protein n=1 Tax=Clostridium akagii TaxID=91623 RepID=UPI000478A704|nr:YncE family protein [Clostridium akagii]
MSNYLFVCNTYSDSISIIDIDIFEEIHRIKLNLLKSNRIGPHGVCLYKNKLLIANNYSNSLSLVTPETGKIVSDFFVGMNCNDVKVCGDLAYVICGDSNKIIQFNMEKNEMEEQIPCEDMPHSIDLSKQKQIMVTANMNSDSITIADYGKNNGVRNVRVGSYPTKAIFSIDGNDIYICESNIGSDQCGSISIVSSKDFRILYRIPVGNTPVDMHIEENLCFVSNFGDGTISIVDLNKCRELKRIEIGGMPRGILKYKENLYVGDNYNNLIFRINLNKNSRKKISIGREPSGMLLS